MYQYILFDLDGTLTDPGEGITNSVAYALKKYNIIVEVGADCGYRCKRYLTVKALHSKTFFSISLRGNFTILMCRHCKIFQRNFRPFHNNCRN